MFFLPPPHVSLVWFQICYPPNTPTPSLPKQGSRRVFHITSIQRFTAGFSRCLSYFNFPPYQVRNMLYLTSHIHTKVHDRNFLSPIVFKFFYPLHSICFCATSIQTFVPGFFCRKPDLNVFPSTMQGLRHVFHVDNQCNNIYVQGY